MSEIRNTTEDFRGPGALIGLGLGMGGSDALTAIVTDQESAGQRQLVNSDRLPTDGSEDPEFLALGFTFGPVDARDPLFRPATLPPGWKREAADHAMHSHLVDELGRKRVAIFYKAAFYDRRADMRLVGHAAYLRGCLWDKTTPVLDGVWLPVAAAAEVLESIAKGLDKQEDEAKELASRPDLDGQYWTERAEKHRGEAEDARTLAAAVLAGAS